MPTMVAAMAGCSTRVDGSVRIRIRIEHSVFPAYSDIGHHAELMAADIGKFVNVAVRVRISPGFQPVELTASHTFRRA